MSASAEVLCQARFSLFKLTYRYFINTGIICLYISGKKASRLLLFFSQLKIVFKIFILLSNISNKKSIYSKTSFQEMQQPLPFPPAFSDHILFYISIFLLSFMPSGSSVLRRYCSTGSFHRFPYVYPSQGFFPGLFL